MKTFQLRNVWDTQRFALTVIDCRALSFETSTNFDASTKISVNTVEFCTEASRYTKKNKRDKYDL